MRAHRIRATLLLALLGCETKHELVMPPPSDAMAPVAPPGQVTGVSFDAVRERAGVPLPGPMMLLRLALADFVSPPTALSLHIRCQSGNRVFVDDGTVAVSQYSPDAAAYAVFGGMPMPALPERCEVRVHAQASAGSGVRPRQVGLFCARPGRISPYACRPAIESKAPPNAPPFVVDEAVGDGQGAAVFSVTRWSGPPVPDLPVSCFSYGPVPPARGLGTLAPGTSRRVSAGRGCTWSEFRFELEPPTVHLTLHSMFNFNPIE